MTRLPSEEALASVANRLRDAGIPFALGGSALGHALGLVDRVGDWDLTTDAPLPDVRTALADLSPTLHGHSGIHADHKLVCFDGEVEVICQMAFFTPEGIVRIPTIVTATWNGYPVGSPIAWAVAYALMAGDKLGYAEKSARLFDFAAGRVTDAERQALATQPIPSPIAAKWSATG